MQHQELIEQINELSMHVITQRYQQNPNSVEEQRRMSEKGQNSVVHNIKKKDRKRKRDESFEHSGKKRSKKQSLTAGELTTKNLISRIGTGKDIDIIEVDDTMDNCTTIKGKTQREFKKLWRDSQALDPIDFNKLKQIHEAEDYSGKLWSGIGLGSYIDVADALKILGGCKLHNGIIDCWADMLREIDECNEMDTFKRHCYFINSLSWSFVTNPKLAYARQAEIDNHIPIVADSQYVIFPMNSNGRKENSNPDHWTLLVLNTEEGTWTHYNSFRPRKKDARDVYLEDAIILKNYVEHKITEYNNSKGLFLDTQDKVLPIISCETCPQQIENSVNCGVFVCYVMKKLTKGEEIEEKLTTTKLKDFQAEMVSLFLNHPNSWTEADFKIRQELRKTFVDK